MGVVKPGQEQIFADWATNVARMEKRRIRMEAKKGNPRELVRQALSIVRPQEPEQVQTEIQEDGSLRVWEETGRGWTIVLLASELGGKPDRDEAAGDYARTVAATHILRRLRETDRMPDGLRDLDAQKVSPNGLTDLDEMFKQEVGVHVLWGSYVARKKEQVSAALDAVPVEEMERRAAEHERSTAMRALTGAVQEAVEAGLSDDDMRACFKNATARHVLGS